MEICISFYFLSKGGGSIARIGMVTSCVTAKTEVLQAGRALASAGPNARPRHGAHRSSGAFTPSCSVNRAMTCLMNIF